MKREQRQAYLLLADVELPDGSSAILCSFCRYAEWSGGCKDAESQCRHPLADKLALVIAEEQAVEGSDCWAFRPRMSQDVAISMVSNWLQNKDVILTDEFLLPSSRAAKGRVKCVF